MKRLSTISKSDVILHVFDWPYQKVAINAQKISALGYRAVLVSPPMKSFKDEKGTPWWQRYQPQDYRIIDNQLGNTDDFRHMVNALNLYDVCVYADVVFNHMANESSRRGDLQYPSADDLLTYGKNKKRYQELRLFGDLTKPLFTEDDFNEAFGIKDWKNRWQVQNGRICGGEGDSGLPTLRENTHVVQEQQSYLKALIKLGVRGFRIDAAKHMSISHLKKVWAPEIVRGLHIFGEIITDGGAKKEEYELFLRPYLEQTRLSAYDFPLFNTVFEAFQNKGSLASLVNPYSLGQALSNPRAITFVITHDIPNNEVFKKLILEEEDEWLAYAYILGRDGGVPLIYTDLNTSGIKNRQEIPRWVNSWEDPRMAAMIAFHNLTHGEKMLPVYADTNCLVFSRGERGFVAINKDRQKRSLTFFWRSPVIDLMTNASYHPQEGEISISLSAKSSMMCVTL